MKAIILLTALMIAGFATLFVRQRSEAVELQAKVELAALEQRELAALIAQRERLTSAQIPSAQLRLLRADRAAVTRLRGEMESLKRRAEPTPSVEPEAPAPPAARDAILAPPTVTEGPVSENFLRNAGRATPAAALETALWAATGGDVDMLANTLVLDPEARTKAEQILAALPAATRSQYRTAEHLVAALTVKDIPLNGLFIMAPKKEDPTGTRILARMPTQDGKSRTVAISLRQNGDEWRLVVPPGAVEKYGRMLARADAFAPGN